MRPFCLNLACRLLVLAVLLGPFLLAGATVLLSAQARSETAGNPGHGGTRLASFVDASFAGRVN